jgi:hypothetical protein
MKRVYEAKTDAELQDALKHVTPDELNRGYPNERHRTPLVTACVADKDAIGSQSRFKLFIRFIFLSHCVCII